MARPNIGCVGDVGTDLGKQELSGKGRFADFQNGVKWVELGANEALQRSGFATKPEPVESFPP